jgi:hypothetical protein
MVVRLSALRTGRLYPQEIHVVLISFRNVLDVDVFPHAVLISKRNSTRCISSFLLEMST